MIACRDLQFRYPGESFSFHLPSLEVAERETVAVVGPSGCGKTTLLRLISGILLPQSGDVRAGGEAVNRLGQKARQRFRIRTIGLVFQEFELLDYLTVRDNILLPYRISSALNIDGEARERAGALAEGTGIGAYLKRYPHELSQGERQRVALCRALVTRPKLILADEPTGSLDPDNQERIIALMRQQAAEAGATLVMVTHDHSILEGFDRTVELPKMLIHEPQPDQIPPAREGGVA